MEPKNIDRLYYEKLKDFEQQPNPEVWKRLEKSLRPKKKRRGIIWFNISGAAAILIAGLFFLKNTPNTEIKNNVPIEIEQNLTNTKETGSPTIDNSKDFDIQKELKTNKTPLITNVTPKKNQNNHIKSKANSVQKHTGNNISISIPENSETMVSDIISKKELIAETENAIDTLILNNKTPIISAEVHKKDIASIVETNDNTTPKANRKWILSPFYGQVFSKTYANHSLLGEGFNTTEKQGLSSNTIGVKVAFQSSEKWTFQTGINRIQLGQENFNLEQFNVNPPTNDSRVTAENVLYTLELSDLETSGAAFGNPINYIKLTYEYLEIPLEAKYAFVKNKKIGLNIIGGFSTLLLTNNQLSGRITSNEFELGSSQNLNDVNFSVNFGSDVEFYLDKNWFININPMIKLQTNTLKNNKDQSYFWGIYSGINFKF